MDSINRPSVFVHDTLYYKQEKFQMPVHEVAVVGTKNAFGVYHFRFSLVSRISADESECIRIDIEPGYGSFPMRAIATIEYRAYEFSSNNGNSTPFIERIGLAMTAGQILEIMFVRNELDKYEFVDPGMGCRHWCASVLDKLAEAGVVARGVSTRFEQHESREHAKLGKAYPMPRIRGTFYR